MIALSRGQEAKAMELAEKFQSVEVSGTTAHAPGSVTMTGGHWPDEDTFVPEVVYLIDSLGGEVGFPSYLGGVTA